MANDKMRETSQQHAYIKTEGKIKVIKGAAALFDKGIKKGTSTSTDKNGVGGSWKTTQDKG